MLSIWRNTRLSAGAESRLVSAVSPHRLVLSPQRTGNLAAARPDPLLAEADIAFGQPDPDQLLNVPRLRWIQLSSAGYTRYDRADIRNALQRRGASPHQQFLGLQRTLRRARPGFHAGQCPGNRPVAGQSSRPARLAHRQFATQMPPAHRPIGVAPRLRRPSPAALWNCCIPCT